MKLSHSARTDVGKTRDHNEDNFGVGDAEPAEQLGELLVVCDGMGGHASGEVASAIGVETLVAGYYGEPGDDRPHALEQAFEQANANIYARRLEDFPVAAKELARKRCHKHQKDWSL